MNGETDSALGVLAPLLGTTPEELRERIAARATDPEVVRAAKEGSVVAPGIPRRPLAPETIALRELVRTLPEPARNVYHSAVMHTRQVEQEAAAKARRESDPEPIAVPLRLAAGGAPLQVVTTEKDSGILVTISYRDGAPDEKTVVIGSPFKARRVTDQRGASWGEVANLGDEGGPLRAPIPDLIAHLRRRYGLSSQGTRALGAYLNFLPSSETVSTRLELRAPDPAVADSTWTVPPVFAQRVDGRTDAAGMLAAWYRPRAQEEARARFEALRSFAVTERLRAILAYVAGAPVFHALAPNRALPRLDLRGESQVGKTTFTCAAVSVLWSLGGGHLELLSGDAIASGFRRADLLSKTDLPVVVDETHLSRREREELRAAQTGATTFRGASDLMARSYGLGAPIVSTANVHGDESDSNASERHADDARRIRLTFGRADAEAIRERAREFRTFAIALPDGPTDPTGGGWALWALRREQVEDPTLSRMRAIANRDGWTGSIVLDLGCALLGMDPVRVEEPSDDDASIEFLEFLRTETAAVLNARPGDRPPPAAGRVRPFGDDGSEVWEAEKVRGVWVTAAALAEYRKWRRSQGRESPFDKIGSLAQLAAVTGQNESDIVGEAEPNRPPRGRLRRIGGLSARCARVVFPHAHAPTPIDQAVPGEV